MTRSSPARPPLGPRDLSPGIFAVVMATGIVSLALDGAGWRVLARALFWINVPIYAVLGALLVVRAWRYRAHVAADLQSHARAPGFFTLVAAPCVLGSQCVLLFGAGAAGVALWAVGALSWLALTYAMLPGLMASPGKAKLEGLDGSWLLVVVATQAVSELATLLGPAVVPAALDGPLFVALGFWLVGSMLYVWLIALIFPISRAPPSCSGPPRPGGSRCCLYSGCGGI